MLNVNDKCITITLRIFNRKKMHENCFILKYFKIIQFENLKNSILVNLKTSEITYLTNNNTIH
jgi:hypothetical protein